MLPSLLLLLLTLALAGGGLLLQRRSAGELEALHLAMRRVAVTFLEASRAEQQLEDLRRKQEMAEKTVHFGTSAVRTLHQGIASIPFGILEAIPVTRDTTRIVRAVHDGISNVVYDSITGTNRLLGGLLRQNLKPKAARPETEQDPPDPI
jgi:hypothetical protein